MTKRKVRVKLIPLSIIVVSIVSFFIMVIISNNSLKVKDIDDIEVESVVDEEIIDDYIPVVNTSRRLIAPYYESSVTVGKKYYDYKGEENDQKESLLVHDNTYIQNNGIDYVSEKEFDVISVLEGTVISVREDETTGSTVEIKHDNGYITVYQSLSEVTVKKGDIVNQGQILGKSGTNELDKELGNHLHFEMYIDSKPVNPTEYLNKEIDNKEN